MKKLFAFCIFAAAVTSADIASAQSFTFVATPKSTDGVGGARPDGTTFGGQMTTGTSEVIWADGKKTSNTYKCMGVTMPPNDSIYSFRMVCDSEGAEGSSSTVWGCTAPTKENNQILCTGWAFGKSGIYAGKRGTSTFVGANGKGSGTGNWAM
jgi:hypothetical protein